MTAFARSSCRRTTASSPRVASSACWKARKSPRSVGGVAGAGWSSAVARRAQPPMLLITRAQTSKSPPCSISFCVLVCIALSGMSMRPILAPPHQSCINCSVCYVTAPIAACATGFLEQAHPLDLHSPVHRLHHVVDREQRDRDGGQRLHLHAGPPDRLGRGAHPCARQRVVERRVHVNVVEAQGVAQRNELR